MNLIYIIYVLLISVFVFCAGYFLFYMWDNRRITKQHEEEDDRIRIIKCLYRNNKDDKVYYNPRP